MQKDQNPPNTPDGIVPTSYTKEELQQQTEQARRVLMRLQWLVIILLGSGIIWLYFSFESVVDRVDAKLTKIDTLDTRLNDMDDRIFAITPTGEKTAPNNAQTADTDDKSSELLRIELALANERYKQGKYDDALNLLELVKYQLKTIQGIATPVKKTLNSTVENDIAHIKSFKNQPDVWQTHIIKMQEIQAFLRSQQGHSTKATLNQGDIMLHDANIMLSLAIGACGRRDKDLMTNYLQEVRLQLEKYITANGGKIDSNSLKTQSQKERGKDDDGSVLVSTAHDALYQTYELLANSPNPTALLSSELLK